MCSKRHVPKKQNEQKIEIVRVDCTKGKHKSLCIEGNNWKYCRERCKTSYRMGIRERVAEIEGEEDAMEEKSNPCSRSLWSKYAVFPVQ